jgi:hypothetical protein
MYFLFYLTGDPKRELLDKYNTPMTVSALEDCRIFLARWSESIMNEKYAVKYKGGLDYFIFNTSGHLEHYYLREKHYIYEVPCYVLGVDSYENVYNSLDGKWEGTIDHSFCSVLYKTLLDPVNYFWDGQYFGNNINFCYRVNKYLEFPYKRDPIEEEFRHFKIRASKFYKKTPNGRVFQSPTLADYKCLLRRNTHYIDTGEKEADYLYDYWLDNEV